MSGDMTKIFINYRTGDEDFVSPLLDTELCKRFGEENVFRDSRSIKPGLDFREVLWRSLARSTVLLVVIGPRWLTVTENGKRKIDAPDDYVREEIALALKINMRVIPILVGNTRLPAKKDLPKSIQGLSSRQYLRLSSRGAKHDLAGLVSQVAEILDGGEVRPEPPSEPETEPEKTVRPGPDGRAPDGRAERRGGDHQSGGIQNLGAVRIGGDQVAGDKVVSEQRRRNKS